MSRTVESPARREVREALRKIALCIKGLGVDEFNLQQLKSFNIHVDPITLDETSYFAPYLGHLVLDPDDDTLEGPYNDLDDETEHSFTRPIDRAYMMNIHLSSYIS